jgi:hypothetical protein
MASEVNMYQAQVNEYKYELERANRELMDMKKKYYENKRKEQLARELLENNGDSFVNNNNSQTYSNDQGSQQQQPMMSKTAPAQVLLNQQAIAAKTARTRFAGGGFAIK